MSEYQYYEFLAIDRPLGSGEMAELRALSSRATITPHQFVNVYNFGDFRGKPEQLMERYFDAFLYLANWGTRQLMLRLPRRLLGIETAAAYCPGEWGTGAWAEARVHDDDVILAYQSEDEEGESFWDKGDGWLARLLPLRDDLLHGDLRCLYLGWLLCVQVELVDPQADEPPVPPGLGNLSEPLQAFVAFLRIDADLIAISAERSAPYVQAAPTASNLARWIRGLEVAEKDALLLRLATRDATHLREELLLRYWQSSPAASKGEPDDRRAARTAGELLAVATQRRVAREREAAEREAREQAQREQAAAVARARYLDDLAQHEEEAWRRADTLIEAKRAAEYDQATQLLRDLREVSVRSQSVEAFDTRLIALRERYAKRPALLERFNRAGL